MNLFDLTNDQRWAMRRAIEEAGALIGNYTDRGIDIALPNEDGSASPAVWALARRGYSVVGIYKFPLGSDNPPAHYRHNGPHQRPGDPPGYWLRGCVPWAAPSQ